MPTSKHPFRRFQLYSREDVAAVLAPEYRFQPQRGTWGLIGIIPFGKGPNFVFFVTFGQSQGHHDFDEGISEEGLLRWQSQPQQGFASTVIQQFIRHDETKADILLFLRANPREKYAYFGPLKYMQHDAEREQPVHFQWKIIDFDPSNEDFRKLGIELEATEPNPGLISAAEATAAFQELIQAPVPMGQIHPLRPGVKTRDFRQPLIDYEERDRRNRTLGLAGERLVVEFERNRLLRAGQSDLAKRVEHVASTVGSSAGFDVLSFDEKGSELHLEVKTTGGPAATRFYMSAAEVDYARACPSTYEIYRIFNFQKATPRIDFFKISNPIEQLLSLEPSQFIAKLKRP